MTSTHHARIIPLDERRRKRERTARRTRARGSLARPLVALWFGTAVFALAALIGTAATIAMRAPQIGIPAGIAVTTLASWQAAGAYLRDRRPPRA